MHRSDMLKEEAGVWRSGHTPARGCRDPTPPSGLCAVLWLLSDQRVGFCLDRGRSPAEARRLHKHAVARRAAEVRPALDSPVVLP